MNEQPTGATAPKIPDDDTLCRQLDIQWRDHHHMRDQTWKALQIVAGLLIAYIGSGLKIDDPSFIIVGGIVCIVAAIIGSAVTIHHRERQIQKFNFICKLEEQLGLHREDLLGKQKPPVPFSWAEIFDLNNMQTPIFMLLMQIAILVMAAIIMIARLREIGFWK